MLRDDPKRANRDTGRVEASGAGYAGASDLFAPLILKNKPIIEPGRLVGGHNPVKFVRHHRPDLVTRPAHFMGIDVKRGWVQVHRLLIVGA